jgi:hypothetical protein
VTGRPRCCSDQAIVGVQKALLELRLLVSGIAMYAKHSSRMEQTWQAHAKYWTDKADLDVR